LWLGYCAAGFELLDSSFHAVTYKTDGDEIKKGDIIAELFGKRNAPKGERTSLNILQHMSGIATATAQAVKSLRGLTLR
jgi:nicotinate-nucleotide pyrophosphorylase (carboxylating)